ncbi:PAS domain S-box protein [Salinivibrio proteolyticus]|uniref:PAS domain S-box protein n=2 Tax=Salinivibrio TaxID=51366 RepID=UPI000989257E|nr:PAS domain S-box protein [Salinivibrio proteolyticus]OOF30394.1 hybrid sensor histidine kinase/response regulator [Salinivibrio proteolyticus]
MKLSIKLPIILILLGAMMLASVTFVSSKGKEMLKDTILANIEREATLLIRLIDRNLFERYHDANAFPLSIGNIEGENPLGSNSQELVVSRLNNLVEDYKVYRRIAIFDIQGNLMAVNSKNRYGKLLPQLRISALDIKNTIWFNEVINGQTLVPEKPKSTYVTGPERFIFNENARTYDMIFASVIHNKAGDAIGVWVNVVDFSAVEAIVGETYDLLSNRGFISSELTILDREGRIIVDYDPVGQNEATYERDFQVLGQLNLATHGVEGARLAVSGLNGSNISTHYRKQVEQVTGYAHTRGAYDYPGLGWSAMIRVDVREAFLAPNQLYKNSFLMAALLLGAILIIAFYLTRKVTSPLSQLTNAVKKLANGQQNFELPRASREDEIGLMSEELFNLKNIVIERERLNREIEEQRFHLDIQSRAIDAADIGIIITDARLPDIPITYVNGAFEKHTGYLSKEVVGKNCRFMQGDDREQAEVATLRSAIDSAIPVTVVLRNYRKNGELFYNQLHVSPVFDDKGQLTHFIGIQSDITEIKRSERQQRALLTQEVKKATNAVLESEARLRTVLDTALDGIVAIDSRGIIIDSNRSLEVMFGRNRDELIGHNVKILMSDPHHSSHDQYIEKYIKTGERKRIGRPTKLTGSHKSGEVFPIEISIGETWFGKEKGFVGIIKDITAEEEIKERENKLQKELKERELIYRTAFGQAAVGICRVDLDGNFIEVNDKICDILGYNEEALLQLNYQDITHIDFLSESKNNVATLISGKERSFSMDKRYIKRDGTFVWATLSVSVVLDEWENPKYFIAVIEDIESRKIIEDELRAAKKSRDELLRGMQLASDAGRICNWSMDVTTGQLKWDDNMYRLYGVSLGSEVDYQVWRDTLHPEDRDIAVHEVETALNQSKVFNAEFRIINPTTRKTHWVKAAGNVAKDSDSGKEILFGINLDITQERMTQAKLEKESIAAHKANQAKSRFLATMSHEIRTPMNGVIGMVDLLKETALNREQAQMVSTIRDSSFSLLEIINDILDFSKIESGQMSLDPTEVNILNLIEKTLEALWVHAYQSGVNLYFIHDYATPEFITLDSVRVRQVLLNLLGNAIKFTSSEREVRDVFIRTSYCHGTQRLSVSIQDTGVGMTDEQIDKLFSPFTQADSSTTRRYGGTGLGLSISKSFVDLMKGKIDVTSDFGNGSTFTVIIPAPYPNDGNSRYHHYDFSHFSFVLFLEKNSAYSTYREHFSQLNPANVLDGDKIEWAEWKCETMIAVTASEDFVSDHPDIRRIVLGEPPVGAERYTYPGAYWLSPCPLKPSELVIAAAIMCGLESPDVDWSQAISNGDAFVNANQFDAKQCGAILCAEDQPTNQLVLAKQLSQLGYQHEMTANGREALEKWRQGHYSLLITDCHMPDMDGFELTSEIRRLEAEEGKPRTLIIAVTANALVGEADHCLRAGMDDYIAKPVELETLKRVLALRLRGRSLRIDTMKPSIGQSNRGMEDSTSLIDDIQLEKIIGSDDNEMKRAVLSMFWQSLSADMQELEQAVNDQDEDKVKSLAHGARGAATSGGAMALSQLFRNIEKNSADIKHVKKVFTELRAMVSALETELRKDRIIE